jgi:hypothetical protein
MLCILFAFSSLDELFGLRAEYKKTLYGKMLGFVSVLE